MRCRRDVIGGDLADSGDGLQDHVQLTGEHIQFFVSHSQPREARQVRDLPTGDGGHLAPHINLHEPHDSIARLSVVTLEARSTHGNQRSATHF
jgi:hypothetical protein